VGDAGRSLTIGGRVNEAQLALIDAGARLTRLPRAHFVVQATLERATSVIQRSIAATESHPTDASPLVEAPATQEPVEVGR